MSTEKQKKEKNKGLGLLYVLYTLLFIGIQGLIASVIIGAIALISKGEKITVGNWDADIIFTSVSVAVLLETLIFMYFFLLNTKDKREKQMDEIFTQVQTNPDGSTTINIITNNFQGAEAKQETQQAQDGTVPPIPADANSKNPMVIIPSSKKITIPEKGGDKKWMSHTRYRKE